MIILASSLISETIENKLKVKVLPLKPFEKLDAPVSCHPDMLICVIDKSVFCYEDYFNENINLFKEVEKHGYKIVKTKHLCERKYPKDIGLNVLIVGKKIFCNKKYTVKEIIEYGENNGYKIVNVKQGYSACSTFVVDENNVITSDFGMKIAFEKENINAIIVPSSNIILEGYNCGFVGGSGFLFNKTAYFFGDILQSNEYRIVVDFLKRLNLKIVSVLSGRLYDYGGVKILE